MPERIDYAGGAMTHIKYVHEWQGEAGDMEETQLANAFIAQAEATLALVEQQRIANLIALTNSMNPILSEQVATDAATVLAEHHPSEYGSWFELKPDIAAALGIKQEGETK